jgi:hypothetical protein
MIRVCINGYRRVQLQISIETKVVECGYSAIDIATSPVHVDSCAECDSGSDITIVAGSYVDAPNTNSYEQAIRISLF